MPFFRKSSPLRIQVAALGISVGILASISACNFKYEKDGSSNDTQNFGQANNGYRAVNAAIFKPMCLGCHATRTPVLTTYEAVVANIADIQDTVLIQHTMPRKGPLSGDLQTMLRTWITAGMPREGTLLAASPTVGGVSRPYTFVNLKADVLEPKCVTCHNAKNPDGDAAPLETYAQVMSVQDWLLPFVITGKLPGGVQIPVDQMMPPPSAAPLTDSEKALFMLWIGDGLRDESGVPAPIPSPSPSPSPVPSPIPSVIPPPSPTPGVNS